jgi:hypothetical protein
MPSSETLSTLRARVENSLQDAANAKWTAEQIDEAITQALQQYSHITPAETVGTIALVAAGREISLSTLTGYLDVLRVWWDYDSSDPAFPPNWRDFEVWPGDLLYINDPTEPQSGDVVRVWYTKPHTLNGLSAATATTFPVSHERIIIQGAVALALIARSSGRSEKVNVDSKATSNLLAIATASLHEFNAALNRIAAAAAPNPSGVAPGPPLDRWDEQSQGWA